MFLSFIKGYNERTKKNTKKVIPKFLFEVLFSLKLFIKRYLIKVIKALLHQSF